MILLATDYSLITVAIIIIIVALSYPIMYIMRATNCP